MAISVQITGLKELQTKFSKFRKQIRPASIKAMRRTLIKGKRTTKTLAPQKTGILKAGITRRTFVKNGEIIGILSSSVPGRFPYNLWVNETSPYIYATLARRRTSSGHWPTRVTRARWPRIYTKRMRYRDTKRTGIPGFMTQTRKILEKKAPEEFRKEIRNRLREVNLR